MNPTDKIVIISKLLCLLVSVAPKFYGFSKTVSLADNFYKISAIPVHVFPCARSSYAISFLEDQSHISSFTNPISNHRSPLLQNSIALLNSSFPQNSCRCSELPHPHLPGCSPADAASLHPCAMEAFCSPALPSHAISLVTLSMLSR